MFIIFKVLIAIIFSEAITELVVKSDFFAPLRKSLYNKNNKIFDFIHDILDCGYCFSVWAALFTLTIIFIVDNIFINYFIYIIVIHRLSNILHNLIDRTDRNKD